MRSGLIIGLVGWVVCSSAAAAPLDLVPTKPDIASGGIAISYNATTHLFTATGRTVNATYLTPPTPQDTYGAAGSFALSCYIDNYGNIIAGQPQSLVLSGDIDDDGSNETYYSSNALTQFTVTSVQEYEFIFTQTAASGNWNDGHNTVTAAGTQIGVILLASAAGVSPFSSVPDFSQSFSTTSAQAQADTFPVPEPGTLGLAVVIAGLIALRRDRQA